MEAGYENTLDECDFVKKDPRPESYHPVDPKQMVPIGHIDTSDNWRDRREYLLRKATVYGRLEVVIDGAKSMGNNRSALYTV